jgi:hypothetical protein
MLFSNPIWASTEELILSLSYSIVYIVYIQAEQIINKHVERRKKERMGDPGTSWNEIFFLPL